MRVPIRGRLIEEPDDKPFGARDVWTALLAAAGAVATLAGLMYFVGAVSLWIALRNRGYPAEFAIEHQPRGQLIGIGIRGGIALATISLILLAGSFCLSKIPFVRTIAGRATLRGACVASFLLLVVASFVSWRWFALSIAASALLIAERGFGAFRWPLAAGRYLLAALAAATVTTIAWVAGGIVTIPRVQITPATSTPVQGLHLTEERCEAGSTWYAEVEGKKIPISEYNGCERSDALREATIIRKLEGICGVPYFGETDSLLYVGAITKVLHNGRGCRWDPGPIVELRRDEVRLSFRGKTFLAPSRRPPISAVWHGIWSFFDGVDLRLLPPEEEEEEEETP